MKTKDIQVDGEYAYSGYGRSEPGGYAHRVRVIALTGGTVTVEYAEGGRVEQGPVTRVICTWADQEAAVAAKAQYAVERLVELRAIVRQRNADRKYLVDLLGKGDASPLPWWADHKVEVHADHSGVNGGDGKVTVTELAAIVRAAYLAGHRDGIDPNWDTEGR